jgi:hypothetical protein
MKPIALACEIIILFILLLPELALSEGFAEKQREIEERIARTVASNISCTTDNPSCFLDYQGLKIELANMHTATRPNIYISAVGKDQYVLPMKANCVQIFFKNSDLKAEGNTIFDASVMLNSSGRVLPFFGSSDEERCIDRK